MKSIKSRFLKRFQSVPSIYTSKQHVPFICLESPDRLSNSRSLVDLPNSMRQECKTNTRVTLCEEEFEPGLYVGKKNELIRSSSYELDLTKESDVFEECDCEFDNLIPDDMITSSSSSSSSSSCSSPTGMNCKSIENCTCTTSLPTITLSDFEEKCPPGGGDKVILYTTSLRGIRKTYEDCHVIKFLLESFRVVYFERDVSMNLEFRDELWQVLEGRSIPPRLFIKGRHIGGADQVVMLHEVGMLKMLLKGIPVVASGASVKCKQCGGVRFLLCLYCNGSCKIYKGEQKNGENLFGRCSKCNENGLIKCPTCCY